MAAEPADQAKLPKFGTIVAWSVASAVVLLGGCAGSGQGITPGYESLPACTLQGEIPVAELNQDGLHDCNSEGLNIRMPDGRVLRVAAVGVTQGSTSTDPDQPGEVTIINWGVEGVGVAFRNGDDRRVWGSTDEAAAKQRSIWVCR